MVAFNDAGESIAIVIGYKTATETRIQRLGVRPGCERHGHARHLLSSLAQKLSVLGPPRLVTEVSADNRAACSLFESLGYHCEETFECSVDLLEETVIEKKGRFFRYALNLAKS